jgi:hypothetical protein
MDASETPIERRKRETLERCTTAAQLATCERLHAEDKTAYPEKRQGKTVIAEFRRYCETFDAEKIGEGLYHFSTGGAGGLNEIAHYDIHGFRHVYRHPCRYIEDLLYYEANRGHWDPREDPNGYHSFYVYTDGMTAGEVFAAILVIAGDRREVVRADFLAKANAAALAQASELAARIGMPA